MLSGAAGFLSALGILSARQRKRIVHGTARLPGNRHGGLQRPARGRGCSTAGSCGWPRSTASRTARRQRRASCTGTCWASGPTCATGCGRPRRSDSGEIASVGVDTWGVDFGLLGRGDELLGNPYHYRDRRTDGMLERAFGVVPREEIFASTGLQFMQFNTLYQLLAMRLAGSPLLDCAESLLMMPDLFHWLLTGVKSNEMTDATTTQFYDPRQSDWARELLAEFRLPERILGPHRAAGHDAGAAAGGRRRPRRAWPASRSCCPARTTRPAP